MISVDRLTFAYPKAARPTLRDVSLRIDEGEALLVVGPSGGGKSTFLRCLNGLVPHFHGGAFSGNVTVGGLDTLRHQPRDLAKIVGLVFQDPESQFVADTVEDELAFGMENMGLPQLTMRKRVEEVLDVLGIAHLRRRRLDTLSGGELQRVAIGAVLTMQPKVLILDEPTSQLDPQAAEEVLNTIQRLNSDLGLTVIVAEHRLERVVQYVDRVLYVSGDGSIESYPVREAMELLPLSPPVARLGRALGWSPLPLSVREGKRFARRRPASSGRNRVPLGLQGNVGPQGIAAGLQPSTGPACSATFDRKGAPDLASASVLVDDLNLSYGNGYVVKDLTLSAVAGEILALMGRNGAGKTTLLRSLVGLLPPKKGSIRILDRDVTEEATERLARHVAFVPQDPASVLFRDSVESEIADTLAGTGREGSVEEALREWRLEPLRTAHPRDLSAGERQRAALATMLVGRPSVILLDEPTRGMDYETKELLVANLRRRCREGAAVVLASHDVELVASCADRVVLLAGGSVVATGSAREVLTESVTFSTQVNKLFGGDCLTIEDVLGPQERSHDTEA